MALVAGWSYFKTRGTTSTANGYFLAGNGLTGTFIAGSLLLTNLSAEQLIGLNGSAFAFNLSAMAWEVTAGIAIIVMALVFLPRYLRGAFTTLPEFLETRYDAGVRRATAALFLLGYGLITIPSILYSGSLAVIQLFDIPTLLQINEANGLAVTIIAIGVIGGLYAIFGGLRAVAISDTLNGVGLLIVGSLVPVYGLIALGDGSFSSGLQTVLTEHTYKLNAIGTNDDPTPFTTLFTGMLLANLFYWGTNQYVIQRTLGARSLAEGQKGVLLAGFFKLLVPYLMMFPGVIAFHLYQDTASAGMTTMDQAYPRLVADVLPAYLSGFFLAVLLGAVFSSFNSLLNSAATLFVLDIYQPLAQQRLLTKAGTHKGKPLTDHQLIRIAKIASLVIALFSFGVAPLLSQAPEGLWQLIRVFTGFYNIPVITLVIAGLFLPGVSARGAKLVITFHILSYGLLRFVLDWELNFVHSYALLFLAEMLILWFTRHPAAATPAPKGAKPDLGKVQTGPNDRDLTPWRFAKPTAVLLAAGIVFSYLLFSPLGLVNGITTRFWVLLGLWLAATATAVWLTWTPKPQAN